MVGRGFPTPLRAAGGRSAGGLPVARPYAVPPRLAGVPTVGGHAGRRRNRGKADVGPQRRRLRTSKEARQAQQQRHAHDRPEGKLGDILPSDPRSAAHRALQPRRLQRRPLTGQTVASGTAAAGSERSGRTDRRSLRTARDTAGRCREQISKRFGSDMKRSTGATGIPQLVSLIPSSSSKLRIEWSALGPIAAPRRPGGSSRTCSSRSRR